MLINLYGHCEARLARLAHRCSLGTQNGATLLAVAVAIVDTQQQQQLLQKPEAEGLTLRNVAPADAARGGHFFGFASGAIIIIDLATKPVQATESEGTQTSSPSATLISMLVRSASPCWCSWALVAQPGPKSSLRCRAELLRNIVNCRCGCQNWTARKSWRQRSQGYCKFFSSTQNYH